MSSVREERAAQSGLVDFLWRSEYRSDGVYLASADASWDLIFFRNHDGTSGVLLCGPSYKTVRVPYSSGDKHFGICFKPWAAFPGLSKITLLNGGEFIPVSSGDTFVLQGISWRFPTYENLDEFVAELEARGCLAADPIIQEVLENRIVGMSLRSIQRYFMKTIGMSPRRVRQIDSARTAVKLLQQGHPLTEVAYDLNYADLPHMTRMLRRFTGYTSNGNKQRGEPV